MKKQGETPNVSYIEFTRKIEMRIFFLFKEEYWINLIFLRNIFTKNDWDWLEESSFSQINYWNYPTHLLCFLLEWLLCKYEYITVKKSSCNCPFYFHIKQLKNFCAQLFFSEMRLFKCHGDELASRFQYIMNSLLLKKQEIVGIVKIY